MKTCDRVIQSPGSVVSARVRRYARTSSTLSMSGTGCSNSYIDAFGACTWESISPGSTVLPPRSTCSVSEPASLTTSAFVPVAAMRPSRIAMAWTIRNCGSTVTILPLWKMWLGGGSPWQPAVTTTASNRGSKWRFIGSSSGSTSLTDVVAVPARHHLCRSQAMEGASVNIGVGRTSARMDSAAHLPHHCRCTPCSRRARLLLSSRRAIRTNLSVTGT